MPGGVHFVVGDLTTDADAGKHRLIVQQTLYQFVDLRNAENMLFHGLLLIQPWLKPGQNGRLQPL